MTLVDQPLRIFQVWGYTVGMGRLLLRSPKGDAGTARIDVLFQNVKAVKLTMRLSGLHVRLADAQYEARITAATGLLPDRETRFYVVADSSHEGYVVAGVCVQAEDEREYFEPSELWPER